MATETDDIEAKKTAKAAKAKRGITTSSTAEYFSKNLQQVGFSSPTKAVLTTLKEAIDNSLDACEEEGILPELIVEVEKIGAGSLRNTDKIRVMVQDNGPGIEEDDIPKVFGEYLASSKFGRGRCSRGQQGIGISAATTWALQTTATGAKVVTKRKGQRKAVSCVVEMDLKNNKGLAKNRETIDWDPPHGTKVEFVFDGRIQLNGEAGLISYIQATIIVNPHITLTYKLPDMDKPEVVERVTKECPQIPDAVDPHPHTMKLGEFIAHGTLFGKVKTSAWLKKGFSRISDNVFEAMIKGGIKKAVLEKPVNALTDVESKELFEAIQKADLMAPSTQSVLSVGEQGISKSIKRLGDIDFFSVVSRKPAICDFKPVQVEVAIARLLEKKAGSDGEEDPVQVLRFANRVPLQFDKAACAIVKAINTVNWRNYNMRQPKNSLPFGPYIICVSVVSPFIKFKNASKETIDASDDLVEEIRRALMQAGQRLSRHITRENKENELEERIRHIEKFGPILVETLVRITKSDAKRKLRAEEGLVKILGRDAKEIKKGLSEAESKLDDQQAKTRKRMGDDDEEISDEDMDSEVDADSEEDSRRDDGDEDSGDAEEKAAKEKGKKAKKTKAKPEKEAKKAATKAKAEKPAKPSKPAKKSKSKK
jgi:DNA topoisomerase-6 subunit B